MPCKYGPIFAPYLHDWTLYGINTVQKQVRIYMAFFLCKFELLVLHKHPTYKNHEVHVRGCMGGGMDYLIPYSRNKSRMSVSINALHSHVVLSMCSLT